MHWLIYHRLPIRLALMTCSSRSTWSRCRRSWRKSNNKSRSYKPSTISSSPGITNSRSRTTPCRRMSTYSLSNSVAMSSWLRDSRGRFNRWYNSIIRKWIGWLPTIGKGPGRSVWNMRGILILVMHRRRVRDNLNRLFNKCRNRLSSTKRNHNKRISSYNTYKPKCSPSRHKGPSCNGSMVRLSMSYQRHNILWSWARYQKTTTVIICRVSWHIHSIKMVVRCLR